MYHTVIIYKEMVGGGQNPVFGLVVAKPMLHLCKATFSDRLWAINVSFWFMPATFIQIVELFIKDLQTKGKSPYTTIAYKKDLEQFFEYVSLRGITSFAKITSEVIESFVTELVTVKEYTKKSASRKLNSIRTLFRFLKAQGVIPSNPASEISHPKFQPAAPRILTKLEYRGLRDVAKKDPRVFALVELLLQTGMKIGELAQLKIDDIKQKHLYIPKTGNIPEREIPLNKPSEAALKSYLSVRPNFSDPHVFITRTGKPMLIRNIRQVIDRCFAEVGIQAATVNDLRNTFIAHQLTTGVSLEYIARIVGHRRLSSTERFLHLIKQDVDKREVLGEL